MRTLRHHIIQNLNPESQALVDGFALSLRAENKAPRTVETYTEAVSQFAVWLDQTSGPALVDADRTEIPGFLDKLLTTGSDSTARNRYSGLRQFYRWLVAEDELDRSPMAEMKPPALADKPIQVLTDDQLRRLLAGCAGTGGRGDLTYALDPSHTRRLIRLWLGTDYW